MDVLLAIASGLRSGVATMPPVSVSQCLPVKQNDASPRAPAEMARFSPLQVIAKWAELQAQGHLFRKETSLDADFLIDVFGKALGYRKATDSPEKYELERNFTVPGVGTADDQHLHVLRRAGPPDR